MHGNGLLPGSIIHVYTPGNRTVRKLTKTAFMKVVTSSISILASGSNNSMNVPDDFEKYSFNNLLLSHTCIYIVCIVCVRKCMCIYVWRSNFHELIISSCLWSWGPNFCHHACTERLFISEPSCQNQGPYL